MAIASASVQTCGACHGTGTVRTPIFNTVMQTWRTLTETCLACMGTGSR